MKKYQTKPTVIEACQFTEKNKDRVLNELAEYNNGVYQSVREGKPVLLIPTLEGEMTASMGDYIIKGSIGELYPCKPEVFHKKYEPLEEQP